MGDFCCIDRLQPYNANMSEPLHMLTPVKKSVVPPALLYEMMRSFVALAETLNLSQAVEELVSTRQTVRRHIAQLEEAMGGRLFEVTQRRYALTELGARALAPAQLLLDQGQVWYLGKFHHLSGMLGFSYEGESGWVYHQQQQPISKIWSGKSDLLRAAVKAWTASEGQLESPYITEIRPYVLAYRKISEGWICVEVGEKSFYSNWFGWTRARSSVGCNLNDFPGGQEFASLAMEPFTDVSLEHGLRLDQVMTRVNSDEGTDCISFDRLLLGMQLPDGTPAIVSVVDRAHEMRIADLDQGILDAMPEKASIDFTAGE